MKESEWLAKAKPLHKSFVENIAEGKGSVKCTLKKAQRINELQHANGSHHGIHEVTYKEARASLDKMFDMVKAHQKTPPLSKG